MLVAFKNPQPRIVFPEPGYKLRFPPETKKRMAVDPTIETAPNVVILEASHARRGFAISWIAQTLVTAALIGICLHAEVVAYVARYAGQQEISKLITIVSPVMAQQTPLPKDDEAVQLKQAVDSARNCGSLCSRSTTGPKRSKPNW
jgi:hypothetical protein